MDIDDLINQLEKEVAQLPDEQQQSKPQEKIQNLEQPKSVQQKVNQIEQQKQAYQKELQQAQQELQTQQKQQIQQQPQQVKQQQPQQVQVQQQQVQQPKQQPQQQQQQIQQLQQSTQSSIIEKESIFTKPAQFKSLSLLATEINIIQNTCLKQPAIQNNSKFSGYYANLGRSLQQQLSQLIEFVESGKLRFNMYPKFVMESMKDQKELFGLAQSNKDPFFSKRIANRLNLLQTELTLLKQSPEDSFNQIVKKVKPNANIPQGQAGGNIQKGKPKPMADKNDLKNFKSNMNAQKLLEADLDNQPAHVKYEALLKRHKEYYNFVLYLSNNAKEARGETLQQLFKLLEKSKFLREEFTKGKNPVVGNFLVNEMKELTLEVFHEMNVQQYKNAQAKIFNELLEGNNKEKEFQKLALHSKRIQIGKNQTYNPHEESKARLQAYGQAFDYLKQLQVCQWILLPLLETQDLKVPICIENKEIPPNVIKLKFIKLSNCKYEKYYLTFSLETSKGIISKQTEICDKNCVFNFDHDIPQQANVDYAEKFIEVRLFEKGFFGSTEIGVGKFSLGDIKSKTLFEGMVNFDNKKQTIQLSYILAIREPLDKYVQLQIKFVKICKMFPVFDPKEGMKDFLEKFMQQLPTYEEYKKQIELKRIEEEKEEQLRKQQQILEEQQRQQQQQQQQQQATAASQFIFLNHMESNQEIQKIKSFISTNPQLPAGLSENDLLYPENPAKFPVFNFINQYEELSNQKSIELKQEPSLKQWARFCQNMWEDYMRQKTIISRKLDNEEFEWYVNKISNLLPMELVLIEIYQKLDLPQWVKFVQSRKEILEKELQELEQMNE